MICPGCRTLNFRDYKFCRECGQKLGPPAPAGTTVAIASLPVSGPDDGQIHPLLDQAFRAFDAGNLSDAALACQGALAIRPESTAAHSMLGLVYERQGAIEDAIHQYKIVLDLNPASQADRAKLKALLRRTGTARPHWSDRLRPVSRPLMAAGAAAGCLMVVTLIVLARSADPPANGRRSSATPVRTALYPAPAMVAPALPAVPTPPPTAGSGATMGGFPRRMLSNAPIPVRQMIVATPSLPPRLPPSQRPAPEFLAPAPIREVGALRREPRSPGALPAAAGDVPVLPEAADAPTEVAAPRQPSAPPSGSPPAPAPSAENGIPGATISIRRLPPGAAPGSSPSSPGSEPGGGSAPDVSLAEARQHYNVGVNLQNRGDLAGAYREFEYARELFRIINNRGGAEGPLAVEGVRASHRAMQALAAARQ